MGINRLRVTPQKEEKKEFFLENKAKIPLYRRKCFLAARTRRGCNKKKNYLHRIEKTK